MIGLLILLSHSPCWTLLSSFPCIAAWNARQINRCFALFCLGTNSLPKVVQTPFQTHCLSVETTLSLKSTINYLTLVKKMPLVQPVPSLFQFNFFHTTYKITHFSICFLFETHSGTFENSQFQCKCQLSSVHLLFEQTVFVYAPSCCSRQVFAFVSHYLYCIFLCYRSPIISQHGFSSIRSDNTISWIVTKKPI